MFPLIEIKTIPIEIQVKTKAASLEYTRGTAEMEISRSEDGVDIKSRPVRVRLDSYEARKSGGSVAPATQNDMSVAAQDSRRAAWQATAVSGSGFGGALQLTANVGRDPEDTAAAQDFIDILPPTGDSIDLSQIDGMEIRYEMDKLNFDWKIEQGEFKFTPGDIEITVEQRPQVVVKYVGGPIYVPPSSNPNYEPVDVKA